MNDNEELPEGKYHIPTSKGGQVVGKILCSRPGLRLIDFYRTSPVLASDLGVAVDPLQGGSGLHHAPSPLPDNMKNNQ